VKRLWKESEIKINVRVLDSLITYFKESGQNVGETWLRNFQTEPQQVVTSTALLRRQSH
jgi:hypothetical protein